MRFHLFFDGPSEAIPEALAQRSERSATCLTFTGHHKADDAIVDAVASSCLQQDLEPDVLVVTSDKNLMLRCLDMSSALVMKAGPFLRLLRPQTTG